LFGFGYFRSHVLELKKMITITRKSPISGKINSMDIPMSHEQFQLAEAKWQMGEMIQNAFPKLSASQREFIKTGITDQEWEAM
jgi:hypothetical protein